MTKIFQVVLRPAEVQKKVIYKLIFLSGIFVVF